MTAVPGASRAPSPEPRTPVVPCDTHTHTARCGHASGRDEEFVDAAMARGLNAIAVTDHLPFYWLPRERHDPTLAMAPEELPRYVEAVLNLRERYRGRIEVLLGIEADYVEGFEELLEGELGRYPFDVVLGSEHWLDGWWVDAPASVARYREGQSEVDRIWARYAEAVVAAARSGLFDVLTHLDLPKKFGFRPTEPFAGREDDIVEAVAASGCAVELSSAGLRKPVGEEYPAPALLRRLVHSGVPLVLSSDAHAPTEVAFAFSGLSSLAEAAGARELVVFRNRRRRAVAL